MVCTRHLGAEAQPAVCDRRIAYLRATHRSSAVWVGTSSREGGFSTPSPASRLSCALVVEVEALLRLATEELALEPVEFVPERVVLRLIGRIL